MPTKQLQTTFRQKKGRVKIGDVEKKYGRDFGIRSDKKLGNYLKEQGYASLSQLLSAKNARSKK